MSHARQITINRAIEKNERECSVAQIPGGATAFNDRDLFLKFYLKDHTGPINAYHRNGSWDWPCGGRIPIFANFSRLLYLPHGIWVLFIPVYS